MNKKAFASIWIILLVVVILVGVGGYYIGTLGKADVSQPETSQQTETPPQTDLLSDCDKLVSPTAKDDCYKKVAVEQQDIYICDFLEVKDYCYGDVAGAKKDLSICSLLENDYSKDYCYRRVGAAKADFSICDMIIHKEQIQDNLCYKEVAQEIKDKSICYNFDPPYEFECLLGTAIGLNDASICEEIASDECFLTIAVQTKDASLCEKIVVGGKKEICLRNV